MIKLLNIYRGDIDWANCRRRTGFIAGVPLSAIASIYRMIHTYTQYDTRVHTYTQYDAKPSPNDHHDNHRSHRVPSITGAEVPEDRLSFHCYLHQYQSFGKTVPYQWRCLKSSVGIMVSKIKYNF